MRGAARAASRPLVSAATVNLARAGSAVMGCSFLGPIRGADGVADNWREKNAFAFTFV